MALSLINQALAHTTSTTAANRHDRNTYLALTKWLQIFRMYSQMATSRRPFRLPGVRLIAQFALRPAPAHAPTADSSTNLSRCDASADSASTRWRRIKRLRIENQRGVAR